MQFVYRASDSQGRIEQGREQANSREHLIAQLRSQGKFPIEIKEDTHLSFNFKLNFKRSSFSPQERLNFTQQLQGLLSAEIPLEKALAILSKLKFSPELGNIVIQLRRALQEGLSFTDALEKFPNHFPALYINMVRAGEAGGILAQVLEKLAQYLEDEINLKSFITSSLLYPAIVTVTGVGSIFFYVGVVIPKFQDIFKDMGTELPFITKFVMFFGTALMKFGWLALILIVLGTFWYYKEKTTHEGRMRVDAIKLKIPLVGSILQKMAASKMALTLSLLNNSGVSLLSSLSITSGIVGNEVMSTALREVEQKVKQGSTLAHSMSTHAVFPTLAVEMIGVGEEGGNLGHMLDQITKTYQTEVKHSLGLFLSLLEPALIIVMVGMIGLMVAAIFLPLMGMNNQF